jgi:RNA polymerase sigma-70 factor (ECF subfamily)
MRDDELVRRYLAGDRGAFGELVRRHERRVYNLALRMLGREEDARDATQDAFLSALRKLPGFRGEAAFTTWVHRITVNACYDVLRRRRREPLSAPAREDGGEAAGPEPTTEDHGEATATAVDVQRALLLVPQDYRAVLVLHDAQDMAYQEVAEVLGIPVGTVKSRLHRGRVALGRALRGEPVRAALGEAGAAVGAGPEREPLETARPSDEPEDR